MTMPTICPRCDSDQAGLFFEAPEGAAWRLHRCPRCYFIWRSTEDKNVTDPALYDSRFKLTEAIIARMAEKPPIPPLKQES